MPITKPPELDKIELPPEPGLFGGWGRKLELTLLRFAFAVFNMLMTPFYTARDKAAKYLFQGIEDELKPVIEPLLDAVESKENVPDWMLAMIKHLRFSEPITFCLIAGSFLIAAFSALIGGFTQPISRIISQEADSYVHSARMTPAEAFAALSRGEIGEKEFHNHVSDGGWSEELEDVWKVILSPLLEIGDLGRLFMRDEIGEGEFDTQLGKRGYQPPEIAKIKTLLQVIPGISDLIGMAVREAWDDGVAARYGYDENFPKEFGDWAAKQGLDPEWAKRYWRAHWNLPGPVMAREMLWRTDMTKGDYDTLLRIADYPVAFRQWMSEVAYTTYTRVDARRMHALGVLGDEELLTAYMDIGYPREKAEKMVEFTLKFNQGAERDLTKSEVLYGYEHRMFSPQETDDLIIALGYDQVEADYYKTKVDFKLWQKMVKEIVKTTGQQYIANQIDQTGVYALLGDLNLPAAQMNEYIREWDIKKAAKTKRLTAERLVKFRTQGVIEDEDFTSEMSGLGYSQRYIGWFLDSIGKGIK